MAQEKSLADQLVLFLRMRDEAAAKIDSMPREGDAWPQLGMMLEQQDRAVRDALQDAAMTANRLGRLAACMTKAEEA
jgi:hypothetical protein